MAIVQFRVDDELKNKASDICSQLGIDLSTALRMFLARTVSSNGIPFPMVLTTEPYDATSAVKIIEEMQEISEKNGNSKMTLDDINREIKLARQERKNRK